MREGQHSEIPCVDKRKPTAQELGHEIAMLMRYVDKRRGLVLFSSEHGWWSRFQNHARRGY